MQQLQKTYRRLHRQFVQLLKSQPQFFQPVPQPLRKILEPLIEESWPRLHWQGSTYIEGWPARDLLLQSMAIGFAYGQAPDKFQNYRQEVLRLCQLLQAFHVTIKDKGRRRHEVLLGTIESITATATGTRIKTPYRTLDLTLDLASTQTQLNQIGRRLKKQLKKAGVHI